MCVSISSTTCVWNISHTKKNWARYDQKFNFVFTQSTCYSCQISMTLEFSGQIFEKYSNIKFYENTCTGRRVIARRWMKERTDVTNLIVAFCNNANTPKTWSFHGLLIILSNICHSTCRYKPTGMPHKSACNCIM